MTSLLKILIDKYAKDEVKLQLRKYEDDLLKFCSEVSIADFIANVDRIDDVEIPKPLIELKFKQEIDPHTCTLCHLDNLRKEYAKKLRLIECIMMFMHVDLGCVCLYCAVPPYCVEDLTRAIQDISNVKFYKEKCITMIFLDGIKLYSVDGSPAIGNTFVAQESEELQDPIGKK